MNANKADELFAQLTENKNKIKEHEKELMNLLQVFNYHQQSISKLHAQTHQIIFSMLNHYKEGIIPTNSAQPKQQIPLSVFEEILSYLPNGPAFTQFGLTCRLFYSLVYTKGCISIRDFTFWEELPPFLKKLPILYIDECDAGTFSSFVNKYPKLFSKLNYVAFNTEGSFELPVQHLPNLMSIDLSNGCIITNLEKLKNLQKIWIGFSNENYVLKVISECKLNELNLIDTLPLDTKYITQLDEALQKTNLKTLVIDMAFEEEVDCDPLKKLLFSNQRIPYINVRINEFVEDLIPIFGKLKNIREIELPINMKIKNPEFFQWIKIINFYTEEVSYSKQIISFDWLNQLPYLEIIYLEADSLPCQTIQQFFEGIKTLPLKKLLIEVLNIELLPFAINQITHCNIEEVDIYNIFEDDDLEEEQIELEYLNSLKNLLKNSKALRRFYIARRQNILKITDLLDDWINNKNLIEFEPWTLSNTERNLLAEKFQKKLPRIKVEEI